MDYLNRKIKKKHFTPYGGRKEKNPDLRCRRFKNGCKAKVRIFRVSDKKWTYSVIGSKLHTDGCTIVEDEKRCPSKFEKKSWGQVISRQKIEPYIIE